MRHVRACYPQCQVKSASSAFQAGIEPFGEHCLLLTTLVVVPTPGSGAMYSIAAGLSRGSRADLVAFGMPVKSHRECPQAGGHRTVIRGASPAAAGYPDHRH
jgi:hypothetical protein